MKASKTTNYELGKIIRTGSLYGHRKLVTEYDLKLSNKEVHFTRVN